MKNILQTKLNKAKILPYTIIASVLVLVASTLFVISLKSEPSKNRSESKTTVRIQGSKISKIDTITLSVKPTNTSGNMILGIKTTYSSPTPTYAIENKPTSIPAQTINSSNQAQTTPPTSVPTPSLTSPTSTPVVVSKVTVEINTPDSSISFLVDLHDGMNICDVLQKAKDDGKISSVTFDDSYMSSLHSKYVYEINGYKNNWTFMVNGNSSLGCSLSNPKPNDTISWKFL